MVERGWPGDWMRGVLDVCVLRAIAAGPTYGYAISTQLEEAGLGPVKGGTLYPLLARLERAGQVDVRWQDGDGGPARKYYALTPTGRAELEAQLGSWATFADVVGRFVTSDRRGDSSGEVGA